MHSHEEELLEPVVRHLRFLLGSKHINKSKPVIIADLGCGPKIRFYHFLIKKKVPIKKYIGIDPLLEKEVIKQNSKSNILLINDMLGNKIPLKNNKADIIVAFAFLEHVNNPRQIIDESLRVLKKGGKAIFTTPSFRGKRVLEFLSFKLGLISPREIKEHKNYFNREVLEEMVRDKRKYKIYHSYFEFGMNNLFVIYKN